MCVRLLCILVSINTPVVYHILYYGTAIATSTSQKAAVTDQGIYSVSEKMVHEAFSTVRMYVETIKSLADEIQWHY